MKPRRLATPSTLFVCLAMLPFCASAQTTGTWNTTGTTGLSWNTAASWTGLTGGLVPNAVGATPNFTFNITAAKTITLDGDRTMGTLTIGDPTSTYYAYTLNAGTPATSRLVFDQTGVADATLTVQPAASTASNVVNAGILLNDNLVINTLRTSIAAAALTLGGVIDDGSGSFSLTKSGPSIIALNGANTYDGGATITAGRINAGNAASFGTGLVTIESAGAGAVGGQAYLSVSAAPYTNAFQVNGIGFTDSGTVGNIGAIRFQGATVTGPITVATDARLGAYNGAVGNINGPLLGGAAVALELNSSTASHNGTFNMNGSASGFLGEITLSQGRLNLAASSNPGGKLTVKDGASLAGETTVAGDLTLGNAGSSTTGPTLFVDPTTSDSLHTNGNLTLNGKTTVGLTGAVTGSSVKVLSYSGTLTGSAANLDLIGGLSAYRTGSGFDFSVANEINLTLVTGDVTWTGAASGNWNSTDTNWRDGTTPTTFYNLDNVTFDESSSANAALTTNLSNAAQNDLVFTAIASGGLGEAVTIEYADPFIANSPLGVSVVGTTITVSLGTDDLGLISSTANAIKAAIEASAPASALVTAALAAGNDGTGLVTSMMATSLALANPTINLASGVVVSPGDMTFDSTSFDFTVSGTGAISGGGTLTKKGGGMLTISTPNTFAGGATLNAGRLRVGSASALGSGIITLTGGQLSSSSTTAYTLANGLALSGSVILGDATNTGALTINGAATLLGNAIIDVPTAATIAHTLGGALTDGADSFSLTKTGTTGSLTLSGSNTYDGGTFINEGRLGAANVAAYGTGPVTVADGAQAFISGAGICPNVFAIAGIGFSETAGNLGAIRLQGNTLSGPITLTNNARITAYGSTGTLTGNISESIGETSLELANYSTSADSTLTLSGTNTYTGGTLVKGAVVVANSNDAFGTGPITVESNGTAARITRLQLGTNVTLDNDIFLNSNALTNFRGAVFSYAGDLATPSLAVVNGDIEVQSGVGNGGHFGAEASSQSVLRIMGKINVINGLTPLVRVGTVELGGGGNYAQLNHGEGQLKLAATDGINPSATLSLSLSGPSTFDLNGWNQSLGGLTKGANNATVTNNGASAATLTLKPATTANFAGIFADGTSPLNLVKSGPGTLTLSGSSTSFTGGILVTEGDLKLTGILGSVGATASMAAASLSGEGTFGGDLTLAGTMVNVDGGTPLGAFVSGNLNTTGGVSVSLQSLPTAAGPIEIIAFGGTLTGHSSNFSLLGASNYRSPVFSVAGNAVNLTLGAPVDLTWTGTGGSNWDINTTSNWNNPSLAPSTFFYADNVTFGNTGGGTISVPANVTASNLVINSNDHWLFQGAGTVSASSVTKDGSGSATFECPINFANLILTNGVLRMSPPSGVTATITGGITGAGTLAKGGDGILSIPSANTGFTGSMVISKGEVAPGNNTAFGTAKLGFGDATTQPTDVCTLTLSTGIALATSQIEISDTCADARITGIGGAITGTTITKKSTGRLTIGHPTVYTTATNYVTGASTVVVEKGTLAFSSVTAMATGTAINLGNANSGSDDTVFEIPIAASADQEVLNAAITLGTLDAGSTSNAIVRYLAAGTVGGAPRINGTVNLNGRDLILENTSLIANPSTSGLYNFAANISGTGNVRIRCGTNPDGTYNGTPRARLMGSANTWTGDLYLETGMLQVGNGSISTTFNAIPNTAVVYLSPGTRMGFGSSGDTFRGLSGGEAAGGLPAAVVDDNTSGGGTITVTLTSTADTENYVYGGTFSGGSRTMVLNKTGPGTQTFNGACSHTGATSITGGKLIVNSTFTSPITVSAGATLGGTMTSTNSITATAAGARIAPGNSTGTLSAASANLSTGGILDLEIDDASTPKNDKLVVSGTLNVSNATLNLLPVGALTAPAYVIASYGTLTGTFGTVTGNPANYDLVYNYDDGVSTSNIALVQNDPYAGWLAAYPSLAGANRAPGVDFDGDGLDNGIEFVIGSDPTVFTSPGTAGFPTAITTGGNLVFSFKRSNASKTYAVTAETSVDLATWPPANAYIIPTVDGTAGAVSVTGEIVTVTIPMAPDATKYARLKAEIPFTP